MQDIRFEKLAKLLVEYSLEVKKGYLMVISAADIASPLLRTGKSSTRKGSF